MGVCACRARNSVLQVGKGGKIKSVNYVIVHHTNGEYKNVADEMDELLGVKRVGMRSVRCRVGKYKEIKIS